MKKRESMADVINVAGGAVPIAHLIARKNQQRTKTVARPTRNRLPNNNASLGAHVSGAGEIGNSDYQ